MSNYAIYLRIQPELYLRFQQVTDQINTAHAPRQAKALGIVLADLACAVLDQVFTELIGKVADSELAEASHQSRENSQQVIDKIAGYIKQYMPYAVSFFNNQRLSPLVNYLATCIRQREGQYYLCYTIDTGLAESQIQNLNRIREGDDQAVKITFTNLIKIIDLGVHALIVKPKSLLKFNFLLNKTLDGVIHMCTHMGYQRLEKVTTHLTAIQAEPYLDHFFAFMQQEPQNHFVTQ